MTRFWYAIIASATDPNKECKCTASFSLKKLLKEIFDYYEELYSSCLKDMNKEEYKEDYDEHAPEAKAFKKFKKNFLRNNTKRNKYPKVDFKLDYVVTDGDILKDVFWRESVTSYYFETHIFKASTKKGVMTMPVFEH